MEDAIFGFVYIWRDRLTKRFYIGSHKGTPDDGYVCSSPKMHAEYRKRSFDFKRRILYFSQGDRIDLLAMEQRWLDMIPKDEFGRKYYNRTASAKGILLLSDEARREANQKTAAKNRGRKHPPRPEEWRRRISEARKGKGVGRIFSKELREKISKSNTGKVHSEDTRRKISENSKKQFSDPEARIRHSTILMGRKLSDEHRANISKGLMGRKGWSLGMMWITDGVSDTKIDRDSPIPAGFTKGRTKANHNGKGRQVICENDFLLYPSAIAASAAYGLSKGFVSAVCRRDVGCRLSFSYLDEWCPNSS